MAHAAVDDDFNLAGDHAHAQGAAHEGLHGAMGFRAEEVFEGINALVAEVEHAAEGRVGALDEAIGVQVDDPRGDIFEDGFHELAAAFEFLHGLLEVAGELIDLGAAVAKLGGHGVEGADENAEFVLDLFGNLIVKVSGGYFASAVGERLNGNSNLLGEKQRDPHGGGYDQDGEEEENQEHLLF